MSERKLTLRGRNTGLSLADRAGCGAPRYMQLENKFLVEFWLFEDDSWIIWNDGQLSLTERKLDLMLNV
jgi:hypothetical protein